MKAFNICIIDLVFVAPEKPLYQRLMYGNYMSIMPQVVGAWCKQEGHHVTYILHGGLSNILHEIPVETKVAFINAFTYTAQRAYAISSYLRSKGVITILGGPHARCYPEDACKYFDFVLGLTDKDLIRSVLNDIAPNRPEGIYLSCTDHPASLPGMEERWEFIEKAFSGPHLIKVVPMVKSLGCPYSCDFCIDATIPFKQLDLESIKEDLRFLLRKMKRPRISWCDPNFGAGLDSILNTIEEAVPGNKIDFIAECSLSFLSESKIRRLRQNGCKVIMPSIESWFGYGGKSGTGDIHGTDKVLQVADHLKMIQRYIPYVHANFLFGTDADQGTLPFELTKQFVELTPGIYPSFQLLNIYGRGAPVNIEFQRANRVLPIPFHLLQTVHTLNIRPKNYTWLEFYDYLIDLLQYSFSSGAIYNRFKAIKMPIPRWLGLIMTLTVGGTQKLKYHTEIRHRLRTDIRFRRFFEQETTEIPEFFTEKIRRDLGPLWSWLPEGALIHDPNAQLKASCENMVQLQNETPACSL
jgi:hypothetical protein